MSNSIQLTLALNNPPFHAIPADLVRLPLESVEVAALVVHAVHGLLGRRSHHGVGSRGGHRLGHHRDHRHRTRRGHRVHLRRRHRVHGRHGRGRPLQIIHW